MTAQFLTRLWVLTVKLNPHRPELLKYRDLNENDSIKRNARHTHQQSSNWFGLDGAVESKQDILMLTGCVGCRSLVCNDCKAATEDSASQATTKFPSKPQDVLPSVRFTIGYSKSGGQRVVPASRWLIEQHSRILPANTIETQTHKLRHSLSLDQLRSRNQSLTSTDLKLLRSSSDFDDDEVRKAAIETMFEQARELTITRQQPVLRDVGRTSRSSRMDSSDRSERLCNSRASSRPSSFAGLEVTKSAQHQPSYSEFYAYIPDDFTLPELISSGFPVVGGAAVSEASYSDGDEKGQTREIQAESQLDTDFEDAVESRVSESDGNSKPLSDTCERVCSTLTKTASPSCEDVDMSNEDVAKCQDSSSYRSGAYTHPEEYTRPTSFHATEYVDLNTVFPQRGM
ncbi:hypothetical protein CSOJ01_00141 [Colletotrichum sojae]|uniref:Uncharacterized protein n=1 Tax=Colletotrichum sojae TaxID=2175907 RepID=A0A8H6JYY9_9PEZI|nr:hypothetical protein CSOJ01_00141 [Colletotrichum sojae]